MESIFHYMILFLTGLNYFCALQVLDHLVIQKLNAEGRLEKKEAKKGIGFDKVRMVLQNHCSCFIEKLEFEFTEG